MKRLAVLFAAIVLAACASMETPKSFTEQLAYADAGLDGVVASVASQYQSGVLSASQKDAVIAQVQKALDALKTAESLSKLNQPNDALKSLEAAQAIITTLQQQVGVKK
jgi:uncharacterized lipoprotein YajG